MLKNTLETYVFMSQIRSNKSKKYVFYIETFIINTNTKHKTKRIAFKWLALKLGLKKI